ncbi:MAG: arginase family protein, partial [Calditrichia bacterium]|nr:arginase family protein [Calditrichia bacterium]
KRVFELRNEKSKIFQTGIRSGSKEEFIFAGQNTVLEKFTISGLPEKLENLPSSQIYFTLDLDVFDPSLISGTGTPEGGGIFFNDFIQLLRNSIFKKHQIIGIDVVELVPELDNSNVSTIVTSQIIRELLCLCD